MSALVSSDVPASPRIAPADAPYPTDVQARFDALLPKGLAPLVLFRVLARDHRLFQRFMGGGLLDEGHLTLRQREIVIDRVTARCGPSPAFSSAAASTKLLPCNSAAAFI